MISLISYDHLCTVYAQKNVDYFRNYLNIFPFDPLSEILYITLISPHALNKHTLSYFLWKFYLKKKHPL